MVLVPQEVAQPEVQLAVINLAQMVISIGLSYLASRMTRRKPDSPIRDDSPPTLADRGAYTNWFLGTRKVGPVFAWAGDRELREESSGGKKSAPTGGGTYYEAGWHILGTGPMEALHGILQEGKYIFNVTITKDSHPSGTTVDLGQEGAFTIYWGEVDQPINTFLGDSERVTISSRWPYAAYIVWNKKRLSSSPRWPVLEYVMERRVTSTFLTDSPSFHSPALTGSGIIKNIDGTNVEDADEDVGWFAPELEDGNGDFTHLYFPSLNIRLAGTGGSFDGDYIIKRTELETVGLSGTSVRTKIFIYGGTDGMGSGGGGGTIEILTGDQNDGANIAHCMSEMLFADYPLGLQIDPDHLVEKWDLESLELLGVEAEDGDWRASVIASEGETAQGLLSSMMQDHGVLLPIDTQSGALTFERVRYPSGTVSNVPLDINAGKLPEIEVIRGGQGVDRLIFEFSDRENRYRKMTIAIDDDGAAGYLEHSTARKVPLNSTIRFETAALLAELRSPEELSTSGKFSLYAGRSARYLIPGRPITAGGFANTLRLTEVKVSPTSEQVTLTCIPDFYGVPKSTFVTDPGQRPDEAQLPEHDPEFAWIEIPEQLLGGFPLTQTLGLARIRANSQTNFTSVWLSRDGSSYTLFGNSEKYQTGGTLDSALSADGPTFQEQGPVYTEDGDDNSAIVQDLSADLTNWGMGRQLCVIVSSEGTEICFLQKATVTSATQRRLDGLLRARYDTRKLDHPSGAAVFIFQVENALPIQDILLEPTEDLYLKSQPGTSAGQVNLSGVIPFSEELYGKGQVPIAPDYLRVRAPFLNSPCFQTGDDLELSWALSTGTPGTGAGKQGAGTAIGDPVIPGTVQIELRTTGDALQTTLSFDATAETYDLTNAALVSTFGSEPSSFKARVRHTANGYSSPYSPYLTITRIA